MLVEGGADNMNQAYASLHCLLNTRVVKRMRQLLTLYKEYIQALNLDERHVALVETVSFYFFYFN